jgi:hypothetical protein
LPRTGVRIATFRCGAPARCGASLMSGASWPATKGHARHRRACQRERSGARYCCDRPRFGPDASSHRRVHRAFRCDAPARSGAVAEERRVVADDPLREAGPRTDAHHPSALIAGPPTACASLVASFAAGVLVWNSGGRYGGHFGVRIATFRCGAPARCGAFVDERRVAVGDGGGRVRTRDAHPVPPGSAVRAVSCPSAGARDALNVGRVIDPRARPWSRRSPRAYRFARRCWRLNLHTGVPIATFRCAAPTRCARSPMSGASLSATDAGGAGAKCSSGPLGPRSTAGCHSLAWPPSSSRLPQSDPVREAGARTDSAFTHRRAPPSPGAMHPQVDDL